MQRNILPELEEMVGWLNEFFPKNKTNENSTNI